MKVQLNILMNREVLPLDYLEEDEVLQGSPEAENDEEGLDVVTEEDIVERFRDQVDEGSLSLDDLLESSDDYTITAKITDESGRSSVWTEKLLPSEVVLMNSFIEQVPEDHGVRDAFINCLQKLAEA